MLCIFIFVFFTMINSQLIIYCNTHSDCYINYYCNNKLQCENCIDITPNSCNALHSDCCTSEYLIQCKNSPYKCLHSENMNVNNNMNGLNFILVFVFLSMGYLLLGLYYNKYILNYKGIELIPNVHFWINTGILVKDGIYFSFHKVYNTIKRRNYAEVLTE